MSRVKAAKVAQPSGDLSKAAIGMAATLLRRAKAAHKDPEAQNALLAYVRDIIQARFNLKIELERLLRVIAATGTRSQEHHKQARRLHKAADALTRELSQAQALMKQKRRADLRWLHGFFLRRYTMLKGVVQPLKDLQRAKRLGFEVSDYDMDKARHAEAKRKNLSAEKQNRTQPTRGVPKLRVVAGTAA